MSDFKPGHTVVLNSGGPIMTVKTVVDNLVYCDYWNPYTHTFEIKKFMPVQLREYVCKNLLYTGKESPSID